MKTKEEITEELNAAREDAAQFEGYIPWVVYHALYLRVMAKLEAIEKRFERLNGGE